MLYILTGDIQIGKTRWLLQQVDELEKRGVEACGVVAPGTWIDHGADAGSGEGAAIGGGTPGARYEKTGIDNLLLPERRMVPFARRRDLIPSDSDSQSGRAGLGWAISDDAIREVNAHFARLACLDSPSDCGRLLIVDEFGRLELELEGGLTEAVALIDRGATPAFPDALIVVRSQLLETALERFADAPWDGMRCLAPGENWMAE